MVGPPTDFESHLPDLIYELTRDVCVSSRYKYILTLLPLIVMGVIAWIFGYFSPIAMIEALICAVFIHLLLTGVRETHVCPAKIKFIRIQDFTDYEATIFAVQQICKQFPDVDIITVVVFWRPKDLKSPSVMSRWTYIVSDGRVRALQPKHEFI